MSSNLKVNSIIPSTGGDVGLGTAGGTVTARCPIVGIATFTGDLTVTGSGVVKIPAVPGTNINGARPVLYQKSDGVIDGGSNLTYDPGGDTLSVGGNHISINTFRGNADLGTLTCDNHSSTTFVKVSSKVDLGLKDNTAGAFNIKEGSNEYITVDTTNSSELIKFGTQSTERLRISKDGAIGLSGANYGSSGQVLTSQGGSAAPQWATAGGATVQSGSWTPAWIGHSGTPSAVDTAYGKYTRIGELVFVECYIKSGTRGSASGPVRVGGLPFDRTNDTHDQVLGAVAWDYNGASVDYSGQNRADHVNMVAWIPNNTGYIRFAHQISGAITAYKANSAGSTDVNWIICGSSSGNYLSFRFSGCYRTDA